MRFPYKAVSAVPPARTLLIVLALLAWNAGAAHATWSIVVADTSTGEVGVASATCLLNFDLKKGAGVIVVGKGAAQAQASGDPGMNRKTITEGLQQGLSAAEILALLKQTDPHLEDHQYGIAVPGKGSVTFTGDKTWAYTNGVAGTCGTLVYAIQGNVLTGEPVILVAEKLLLETPGDLSQKLMAAMHGAQSLGGDGRCSCNPGDPDGCGAPPIKKKKKKEKPWKSAHVAYMVVARIGDTDGVFNPTDGFANGNYYLDLNVIENSPTDPVDVLQGLFDDFRAAHAGHADHLRSEKAVFPDKIPADGASSAVLMIQLADLEGNLLTHGGAAVTVTHAPGSAGAAWIGAVQDHGDGTYTVPLRAGTQPGTDRFLVRVNDGLGRVTLYPFPELEVTSVELSADATVISAAAGDPVTFTLAGGPSLAGRLYLLLGTASGTAPGVFPGGVHVPLNPDLFTGLLLRWTGTAVLPGGLGVLDGAGGAQVTFDPPAGALAPFAGMRLHFTWITLQPLDFAATPRSVGVTP